jgi:hypothetical protein
VTLEEQAEQEWRRGDWAAALAQYRALLEQRLAAELTDRDFLIVERIAFLSVPFGEAEVAEGLLASLQELYRQRGRADLSDYLALQRVHLAIGRGLIDDAIEQLRAMRESLGDVFDAEVLEPTRAGMARWEAARRWPAGADRAMLFALFYLEMGRLSASQGHYGLAIATFEQGLCHARRLAVPLRLALAEALLGRGDLDPAAAQLARVHPGINLREEPAYWVRERELWATLHLLTGEFGACERELQEVVGFLAARGFKLAELKARLNLAHVQILLNRAPEAHRSLTEIQGQAADPLLKLRAGQLMHLAEARLAGLATGGAPPVASLWGYGEDAPPETGTAEAPVRLEVSESSNFLAWFDDRALAFQWCLGRRDYPAAERELGGIHRDFEHTDSVLIQVRRRTREGLLAHYLGRHDEARRIFREVRPQLQAMGLKPELWQALRFSPEAARIAESQKLLDEMAQSLPVSERLIFLLNKWAAEEEFLGAELDRLVALKKELSEGSLLSRLWRRLGYWKRIHQFMERIYRNRALLVQEVFERAGVTAPRAAQSSILSRLLRHPRRRATLCFLVLEDRVFLAWSGWMRLDFEVASLGRRRVRELVAEWHNCVKDVYLDEAALEATGQELAEGLRLLEAIGRLPRRVRRLTILPDDALHGFPFAAVKTAGRYLIERYALSIGYQLQPRQTPAARKVRRPLLAAVMEGAGGFEKPEIVNELGWLAGQWPGVQQLPNDQVSRASLLRRLPEADLFHMVCHGDFQPGRPERTGLILVPDGKNIEVLSLSDLAGLRLPHLQHATLVACWGADNYVLPGRWVIGLAEVLWRAGAHGVLACLWPAAMEPSHDFMQRFYRRLESLPRDEALRQTQLEFLERNEDLLEWAGWQLYGHPGRLRV